MRLAPTPLAVVTAALAVVTAALAVGPASAAPETQRYVQRADAADATALTVTVRAGRVVHLRALVGRYRCGEIGNLAPYLVDAPVERSSGRIARDGRVTARAATDTERLVLVARRRAGALVGTLRATGTIGVGDRCSSGALRIRARRAPLKRPS